MCVICVCVFLKLVFLRYFNKDSSVLVHTIKAYWGVKLLPYLFVITGPEEGRLPASRPGRFIPHGKSLPFPMIRRVAGSRCSSERF